MTNCYACGIELQPESPEDETDYQFDNALLIGFFGGYGMFVESKDYAGEKTSDIIEEASKEAFICHKCAHDLCDKIDWIKNLIDPYHSHSHTQDFWETHPDHDGWDNPSRK